MLTHVLPDLHRDSTLFFNQVSTSLVRRYLRPSAKNVRIVRIVGERACTSSLARSDHSCNDMLASIKTALSQLAIEDSFYNIPKLAKSRLLTHVRNTLRQYEWQFHSATDLAELLDPFLLATNKTAARKHYGAKLSSTATNATQFPPREHDPKDYPTGAEPWIAGFLRQWAIEYVNEEGEVKEGWGDWFKKKEQTDDNWEWPYERILTHRRRDDGEMEYLIKWVGERYFPSWVDREQLDEEGRLIYDQANGVVHGEVA